jgi:hypothetical protein
MECMITRVVTDLHQCRGLWRAHIRPRFISDLWEYRICFHHHYRNHPHFVVMEDSRGIAGLLPLAYAPEIDTFVYFPGEIWNGKTWSERNPIFLRDPEWLPDLLEACPDRTYLRYLELPADGAVSGMDADELGYVLYPLDLGCNHDRYVQRFSRKRFKEISRTIASLLGMDHSFHINRLEDFELLVKMSVGRFGAQSYLYDVRFRDSLRDLMRFLNETGRLRMLSMDIEGATAAVDLGCIYHSTYTVFLGGTDPRFLGVSKAMNMHHIDFAFERRMEKVDFLCGDFHWKKLWHLDPEPLYKYVGPALRGDEQSVAPFREAFMEA